MLFGTPLVDLKHEPRFMVGLDWHAHDMEGY